MFDQEDYKKHEPNYRRHYQASYGTSDLSFEAYEPAYRFGHSLAQDVKFRQYERWDDLEEEARSEWNRSYAEHGLWEEFEEAVKHAWDESAESIMDRKDRGEDYQMHKHSNMTVEESN